MVAESAYEGAPEGFMTQRQVQERLSVSRTTIQAMMKDGRLTVYRDQRDKRVRLFKVRDVERLTRPSKEDQRG